ncbi:MAG: tripartite tricarboxylate transporter substrate binding protein [Chloroflexi bacterium]|nr:tripartite tricarboxylate transporter substrate binding protein [Chloroflexota bacterium]
MFGWTRSLRLKVPLAAVALAVLAGCAAPAPTPVAGPLSPLPDGFPNQPITFVTAAGGADEFARAVNKAAQPFSPVPLVVENVPGTATVLRLAELATGMPGSAEGYGIVYNSFSTMARSFTIEPGKATWSDVGEPVIGSTAQYGFFVKADAPWKDLSSFVKWAKQNPGDARIGGAAAGGIHHIISETFARAAGFQYTYVPHAETPDAYNSLIGGGVDAVAGPISTAWPYVKEGKLTPIGISSGRRSEVYPDVPTFREQGYDVAVDMYRAVMSLASVPKEHLEWLRQLYRRGAESKEFQDYLEASGEVSQHNRIEEYGREAKAQRKVAEEMIRALGLHYETARR